MRIALHCLLTSGPGRCASESTACKLQLRSLLAIHKRYCLCLLMLVCAFATGSESAPQDTTPRTKTIAAWCPVDTLTPRYTTQSKPVQ